MQENTTVTTTFVLNTQNTPLVPANILPTAVSKKQVEAGGEVVTFGMNGFLYIHRHGLHITQLVAYYGFTHIWAKICSISFRCKTSSRYTSIFFFSLNMFNETDLDVMTGRYPEILG